MNEFELIDIYEKRLKNTNVLVEKIDILQRLISIYKSQPGSTLYRNFQVKYIITKYRIKLLNAICDVAKIMKED